MEEVSTIKLHVHVDIANIWIFFFRVDPSERRDIMTEESNDSSTIDPETEGNVNHS